MLGVAHDRLLAHVPGTGLAALVLHGDPAKDAGLLAAFWSGTGSSFGIKVTPFYPCERELPVD